MDDLWCAFLCALDRSHEDLDRQLRLNLLALIHELDINSIHTGNFAIHSVGHSVHDVFRCHSRHFHGRAFGEGAFRCFHADSHGLGFSSKFNSCLRSFFLCFRGLVRTFRIRILGQQAIAVQGLVVPLVLAMGYLVAAVALDGLDAILLVYFGHDTHMVRTFVLVDIEEDKITRLGTAVLRLQEHVVLGEQFFPLGAGGCARHVFLRDVCIVQAELDKHGAPVLVRHAQVGAVTGIAHGLLVHDLIVAAAFFIIQLAFRDLQQVLRPDAGQLFLLRQGLLPLGLGLQVGLRIRIALQGMLMLFLFTCKDLLVAFLCVGVAFALFQGAGKLPHGLITCFRVGVAFGLLQRTY